MADLSFRPTFFAQEIFTPPVVIGMVVIETPTNSVPDIPTLALRTATKSGDRAE